jgi:hypothetical protein
LIFIILPPSLFMWRIHISVSNFDH